MKTQSILRKSLAAAAGVIVIAAAASTLGSAASPKFYPDDPVWVERDTEDASSMKPYEVSLLVDVASNILKGSGGSRPVARGT